MFNAWPRDSISVPKDKKEKNIELAKKWHSAEKLYRKDGEKLQGWFQTGAGVFIGFKIGRELCGSFIAHMDLTERDWVRRRDIRPTSPLGRIVKDLDQEISHLVDFWNQDPEIKMDWLRGKLAPLPNFMAVDASPIDGLGAWYQTKHDSYRAFYLGSKEVLELIPRKMHKQACDPHKETGELEVHINYLELLATWGLVLKFAKEWRHHEVTIYTDSTSAKA